MLTFAQVHAQIKGKVLEGREPIVGANVVVAGTRQGAVTDIDGSFEINYKGAYPVVLQVSFIGYQSQERSISAAGSYTFNLVPDQTVLGEVSVVQQRLSDKQKESALTVEAMDALAIKETPAISFYDGLGNLKGVDLTAASIGFKIINTRGFNSTSPVRSMQVIDGVDNQAPGLNFSLGNFLGASDLDVLNVDVIAGASTAFYGPNAFNGVISMTTKNPYDFDGLSASIKVGERNLTEYAVRWAQNVNNKFAYKINLFYLRANDWEATNLSPVFDSESPANNPGGFNAVNRYGDEQRFDFGQPSTAPAYPGLKAFHREGIEERFLVDYNTENIKASTTLHYRFQPDLELSYGFFFGTGTTVYQGENRFSLKDILFFQNKIQLERKNKWFIRAYSTNEDAGNSYDAYFTALEMQDRLLPNSGLGGFEGAYSTNWALFYNNTIRATFPEAFNPWKPDVFDSLYALNIPFFDSLHADNRGRINNQFYKDSLTPGTSAFQALFSDITTRSFSDGGSRLVDRSALYHIMGQYRFDSTRIGVFTAGGNYRLYVPNSQGTIFSDTNGRRISVYEYGLFGGYDTYLLDQRLKLSLTARVDKNQNFDYLVSPAASVVYQLDDLNTVRFSFSAAVRNPTLQDQFLYYNVGPAILLGNLNGFQGVFRDSLGNIDPNRGLVTIDDLQNFLAAIDKSSYEFDFFDVDPVRPERVRTAEVGYRTTLFDKLFVDANYYYSWYRDFIGFLLVADIERNAVFPSILQSVQPYRISTNSEKQVTTQGFSIGMNYYFGKYYSLSGNYTWNVLNTESDDPIIPAFNTPEHKYNVSFIGREIPLDAQKRYLWGYNMTWRWIQGFFFEGSPQFTGPIDDYGMVDAQTSLRVPKWNTTFKLGGSNLLNNKVYTVYGGPLIGRMLYASITFDWLNNNE